ncbi:signal peptidase II [Marichromatium gracile]|uniref:signal peptidase II n=1 Tax=Marichromatium gracile TaxID=1048 RepID=UPI001F2115E2|nr:signal peptidase II [Marichromatium gracile]MCF1184155.1 signal peptidase II [Marichromatium gracile]
MAESGARSWLWLSLLVLVLDQASKWLVYGLLDPFQVIALTETLHLTLVFNEGAAFSLLAGAGGWQRWLFALIAVAVSIALVIWLGRLRRDQRWSAAALALLLGGALGNLIDRVVLGHVIDFVQVYLPFLPMDLFNPWPAFNVADSAISIGVVILLIVTLFEQPEPRHQD